MRGLRARVDGSPHGIVVRIAAGVAVFIPVLILLALDDPGRIVTVVLVLVAGLLAIAAAAPPVTITQPPPATGAEDPDL